MYTSCRIHSEIHCFKPARYVYFTLKLSILSILSRRNLFGRLAILQNLINFQDILSPDRAPVLYEA